MIKVIKIDSIIFPIKIVLGTEEFVCSKKASLELENKLSIINRQLNED